MSTNNYFCYIAFGSEDCFLMLLSSKKKYGVDTRTTPKESSWSTTCRARAFHGDPRMTTSTRQRSIVQYSSSLMLLRLASPPATTIVVAAPLRAILLHSTYFRTLGWCTGYVLQDFPQDWHVVLLPGFCDVIGTTGGLNEKTCDFWILLTVTTNHQASDPII